MQKHIQPHNQLYSCKNCFNIQHLFDIVLQNLTHNKQLIILTIDFIKKQKCIIPFRLIYIYTFNIL